MCVHHLLLPFTTMVDIIPALLVMFEFQDDGEKRWLAQQLLTKVELSRGLSGSLSALQVEATSQSYTVTVEERRRRSIGMTLT